MRVLYVHAIQKAFTADHMLENTICIDEEVLRNWRTS